MAWAIPNFWKSAALEGRVLVSHDHHTMLRHFRDRLMAGKSSPGLLIVAQDAPIAPVVEALVGYGRWPIRKICGIRLFTFLR